LGRIGAPPKGLIRRGMSSASIVNKPCAALHRHVVRDRREMPRIRTPALIRLRRVGSGHGADVSSVIDNLGAGGFYVRLMQRPELGMRLYAFIKFVTGSGDEKGAARLAVRGSVLRVEELSGGVYGVAVEICQYKFV